MADGKIAALLSGVKDAPGIHYKNPRFPLNIKLPDNLECGTSLYFHGAAAPEAERFAINLKNAETDANNYMHFNPRFDEGCVVRNSRQHEAWGDEERDGEMPFTPGQPFLIKITPTADCYEVEVNGTLFTTFNHRDGMPPCDVTHLTMWGDVTIYGIHVPLSSMPIPLTLRIPKHAFAGDTLSFTGEAPGGAERFHVNFQCGSKEDADIMYHFNPRFDDNALVCNNRCADSWGEEQSLSDLPVTPGSEIRGNIVVNKDGFLPFLNGNPLPVFPHRLDVCAACTIVIDGDIKLHSATIDCAPVRLPPHAHDVDIDSFDEQVVQAMHVSTPVTMPIPSGFGPGKMIYLSAKVPDDPSRFALNLQCGEADADVALHLNPRWDDGETLVLNSLDDGAWADEVREPNPMAPGSEVEIFVLCKEDGYTVLMDGDVAVELFPHRLNCDRVTHVNVDGSIAVHRLMAV